MKLIKFFLLLIIVICNRKLGYCVLTKDNFSPNIKSIRYFEDNSNRLKILDAIKREYQPLSSSHNFGLSSSTFWLKIVIENDTINDELLIEIQNSSLSLVTLFTLENGKITAKNAGDYIPFSQRIFRSNYPLFKIRCSNQHPTIAYLRINSNGVVQVPIVVGEEYSILNSIAFDQYLFGIYLGIVFVMFFYNLFVYLTVRDENYLYYVFYILVIGFTQGCLKGYAGKFLWPEDQWLNIHAQIFTIGLSGIASLVFASKFLNAAKNAPLFAKICIMLICCNIISIILMIFNFYIIAQQSFQITNGIASLLVMIYGIVIYRNGYKPALFLNISWSFFLSGVIIYILKDVGILSYNIFTSNSILIGSALEAILLSFALADKINIYKKEKEEFQAKELIALTENTRLINEQNITLERNVKERTQELTVANYDLGKTLTDLKEAQTQLVEAEKMASLGQLTAGIAHEINNPINFVTANISPLKRDVDVLVDALSNIELVGLSDVSLEQKKQEIDEIKEDIELDYLKIEINQLLDGIHDGASRTAEIVKGLKIFSRLDEDVLKKADINEGLESTLIIANNLIGNKIALVKNLGDIPQIECYPGKLNQVFLNIISNAAFAIQEKFGDKVGGVLKITTLHNDQFLYVKIEDNGTGMSEATKQKIFEPFFTTKDVGIGTGLGMSIVYNTIKKHGGEIELNSTEGLGTEFTIRLNLIFEEVL